MAQKPRKTTPIFKDSARKYSDEDMKLLEAQIILFNAAKNNVTDTFKKMPIELQKQVMDIQNAKEGRTPLMNACWNGHEMVVEHLINLSADLEKRDKNGWTALTYAASRGQKGNIQRLIDAKANINARDNEGWTPLMEASQKGRADAVEQLLNAGCDIATKGNDGMTAADLACDSDFPAIAIIIEEAAATRALHSQLDGIQNGLPGALPVTRPLKFRPPKG